MTKPTLYRAGLRAGILGGGQLARMLAEAALRLGIRPVIFAENLEAPAARASQDVVLGKLNDRAALKKFFTNLDVVIFESEFVDTAPLKELAGNVPFIPDLGTIERLRDKLRQKELLKQLSIPTAPFVPYSGMPLEDWVASAASKLGGRCVFKWGQLGYDGKGVFVMKNHGAEKDAAKIFCEGALKLGVSLFAEQWIEFTRELALVSVASRDGEVASYPLVLSEQKKSICWTVTGPATSLGVSVERENDARRIAQAIASASGIVGTFAIEMFETSTGLSVNELAPRVHNSGHFTQDAADTSQFENHWRAALGLPLGSMKVAPGFAMVNLLGPDTSAKAAQGMALPSVPAEAHWHWYDKVQVRSGRKMGHINGRVDAIEKLAKLVGELDQCREAWEKAVKEKA